MVEKKLAQLSEEDLSAQRRVRDSLNRLSNAVDNARKLEHQVSYRFLSLILKNYALRLRTIEEATQKPNADLIFVSRYRF